MGYGRYIVAEGKIRLLQNEVECTNPIIMGGWNYEMLHRDGIISNSEYTSITLNKVGTQLSC